jgi:predicted HTH transcriptional regulator
MSDEIKALSSEELFKLAEMRRLEEEAERQEAVKQQVADLRTQIRQLDAQYKKDRTALENEIAKLTGKTSSTKTAGRTSGISSKILDIIRANGEISTKDINQKLEESGFKAKNLSQSMAYLKKRGEVASVGHGMYKLG